MGRCRNWEELHGSLYCQCVTGAGEASAYECILQLIEKSKSVPLLYESDARDTLILYLRNCSYAVEDEVASSIADENISSKKSENENASATNVVILLKVPQFMISNSANVEQSQ